MIKAAKNRCKNPFIHARRAESSFTIQDGKGTAKVGPDLYGSLTLGAFLRLTLWALRVLERSLRVFAASFDLSASSNWWDDLEQLKQRLDQLYVELDEIVNPLNEAKSASERLGNRSSSNLNAATP